MLIRKSTDELQSSELVDYERRWKLAMKYFNIAFFGIPIITAAIYLYFIASNMYEVDSIFMVRSPNIGGSSSGSAGSILGGIMSGASGGGATSVERAVDESYAIVNYIESGVGYDELARRLPLTTHFTDKNIDWWNRLSADADHYKSYNYYLRKVSVYYDDIEGEVNLSTYAFSADMAEEMAHDLAAMGETLINQFNERAMDDAIKVARQQLHEYDTELQGSINDITQFQLAHRMIDPDTESADSNSLLTTLRQDAAATRAQISELADRAQLSVPRLEQQRNMLAGLNAQIEAEKSRLAGENNSLAPMMGQFKLLSIKEALAATEYSAAASVLQSDIVQAERQKLYVVSVVPPIKPVEADLPLRGRMMLIVAGATLAAWLILRLVFAAIRDHDA